MPFHQNHTAQVQPKSDHVILKRQIVQPSTQTQLTTLLLKRSLMTLKTIKFEPTLRHQHQSQKETMTPTMRAPKATPLKEGAVLRSCANFKTTPATPLRTTRLPFRTGTLKTLDFAKSYKPPSAAHIKQSF